jgi:predicted metal-binding membrane protein
LDATATTLEAVLARDRRAAVLVLAVVTVACWAWLLPMAADMNGAMDGAAAWMMIPTWDSRYFALMLLMWTVMMAGMMLPSAAPAILLYGTIARKRASASSPLPAVHAFAAGYVLAWGGFSLAATLAQWGLDRAALMSPMMVATSPLLGAAILIAAGAWQWTPLKQACLVSCRSPLHFLASRWEDGPRGALRMGAAHGLHCIGCCWALMLLLFFGGVMSPAWIAAIAAFVLLEKVAPLGPQAGRLAGVILAGAGAWMLVAH